MIETSQRENAATIAVFEQWLVSLWRLGRAQGWALESALGAVVGPERARSLAHDMLRRVKTSGWATHAPLPDPPPEQREVVGEEVLKVLSGEAEQRSYPDLTIFTFVRAENPRFNAWARRKLGPGPS